MRAFLGSAIGGLVIVAAAWLALLYAIPAHGAETCAGTWLRASYYGQESGSRTANGEYFDGLSLTAASRTLPFNTRLRVTYRGQSVVVRINDRGPYIAGRDLDLSRTAAVAIGMIHAGVGRVCAERL